jgi:hypothetical protein
MYHNILYDIILLIILYDITLILKFSLHICIYIFFIKYIYIFLFLKTILIISNFSYFFSVLLRQILGVSLVQGSLISY